jgi:hypothetical protein
MDLSSPADDTAGGRTVTVALVEVLLKPLKWR